MYPQMQNIVADLQDAIISLNLRFCEKKWSYYGIRDLTKNCSKEHGIS